MDVWVVSSMEQQCGLCFCTRSLQKASYSEGDAEHKRESFIHSADILEDCPQRASMWTKHWDPTESEVLMELTICQADGCVDRQSTERLEPGQGWRGAQQRKGLRGSKQRGLERVCSREKEGFVQTMHLQSFSVPVLGAERMW